MLSWFKRDPARGAAASLYAAIVTQARRPDFYRAGGVADTPDGRYDMILLHMFLVLERLAHAATPPETLKQALFDTCFKDMDRNLREMGYGDVGVKLRIEKMVEGFFGRVAAYREGLAGDDGVLGAAFSRNLFRQGEASAGQLAAFCAYLRTQWGGLAAQADADLAAGRVVFAAPDLGGAAVAARAAHDA